MTSKFADNQQVDEYFVLLGCVILYLRYGHFGVSIKMLTRFRELMIPPQVFQLRKPLYLQFGIKAMSIDAEYLLPRVI